MKKLLIAAALALACTACTTGLGDNPASPSAVADTTVLDEKGALAVELAYKVARMAAEFAVDTGVLKGETAAKVAEVDRTAYSAVVAARAAYEAGNAASYAAAIAQARSAISDLLAAING